MERVLQARRRAPCTRWRTSSFSNCDGDHLGLVSAAAGARTGRSRRRAADELPVVVIGSGARRYALVVDAICGEQSLAVQPLDPAFGKTARHRRLRPARRRRAGADPRRADLLRLDRQAAAAKGGLHQLAQGADGAAPAGAGACWWWTIR